MASTIVFVAAILAVANAGFVWVEDNEKEWNPFQAIKMMFPQFPKPPGFPQGAGFPFGGLGLNLHLPNIPRPEDIMKMKPRPGQVVNGVVAKSQSSYTTDKNGKPVRTGGSVVVLNNNGEVEKYETGNNPPNVNEPIVLPSFRL